MRIRPEKWTRPQRGQHLPGSPRSLTMEKMPPIQDPIQCYRAKPARLVVLERGGSWARHLQRLLTPHGPRLHQSRTRRACREILADNPASIVVAEWTAEALAEVIDFADRVRREFPAVRMVAVADRRVEPFRWQIFQSGLVWLCTSPRQLGPVVEIVRRHLDEVSEPPRSPEQRIWDELPWPGV